MVLSVLIFGCNIGTDTSCTSKQKRTVIVLLNNEPVDLEEYSYTIIDEFGNKDSVYFGVNKLELKTLWDKHGNFEVSLYNQNKLIETKSVLVNSDECGTISEDVDFKLKL
jgi:hypothetical protein